MGEEENRFAQLLSLLPAEWEAKAKELGAFKKAREIRSPEELLRMILLYLTEGVSFRGTSALLRLGGEAEISDVAILKRMRNSAKWLQWMCENIYRRAGLTIEKPEWLKDKNVLILDGSETVKCGVRRHCHMLHYSLELFTLAAQELHVTGITTGEKLSNFKKLGAGDIMMGDRMYGTLPGMAYVRQSGADFLLRIKPYKFTVYNEKNEKIDILNSFSGLAGGEIGEIKAKCFINGQYEPIRICAFRKDEAGEQAGLKRLVKENQRKQGGKPVTELQRESNMYIIVATSLLDEITAFRIMELYRLRWQIEIAFKRLKSLFQYNDLPSENNESVKAWFYGKLLLAALCETLVNTGRFSPCGGTDNNRRTTRFRGTDDNRRTSSR